MASISNHNGRKRIHFDDATGKRRSIGLGCFSSGKGKPPTKKSCDAIKTRVEDLIEKRKSGCAMLPSTAEWLANAPAEFCAKLAEFGLIDSLPKSASMTLGDFLADYFAMRKDVKARTQLVWSHVRRNLESFFGAGKALKAITPGDARQWRIWLQTEENLSDPTIGKRIQVAKMFFAFAVEKRWITSNPFAKLKSSKATNRSRDHFISPDDAEKILEACPDGDWRLLFALSRYAGLRCPSEHLALRWQDVLWDEEKIIVRSPKTEHHAGGESRTIPMFPELKPYLEAAFEQAEPGAVFVLDRFRVRDGESGGVAVNLRTTFRKIIERAGLTPWQKLFHNLRATRQTELEEQFPSHVVCKWIGNSERIAREHYLQVTDEHFEQALSPEPGKAARRVARKPAQQPSANDRNVTKPSGLPEKKQSDSPRFAANRETLRNQPLAVEGLEPPTRGL